MAEHYDVIMVGTGAGGGTLGGPAINMLQKEPS
jgi:hypothetical protein